MHNKKNIIQFDKFASKNNIIFSSIIVTSFIILFIIIGCLEKNLLLPKNGLGLLNHINVWILFFINISIPYFLYINIKILKRNINHDTFIKLEYIFNKQSTRLYIKILYTIITTIGFCIFVGNSLQNAHIINQLPFDYWDSIDYILSYTISRFYKFYIYTYFFPFYLINIFLLIKSVSELLYITENDINDYPIKNYMELNELCNVALNSLLVIIIPIIIFSSSVYVTHQRKDIVTISTLIIAVLSTIIFSIMYIILIKKYQVSVLTYKKIHINIINEELSQIHKKVLKLQPVHKNNNKLELYLKKEIYLRECKEMIENISKYPLIIKAIITIISPMIPSILKYLFLLIKNFF